MTGSEQVSPTQTKACGSLDARTCCCAGCDGGKVVGRARVQHDAIERRNGARRGEQRFGARALPGHHDLGGAQPQIDGVEQRHVHVEILDGRRRDRRDQPVGFVAPAIVAGEQRQPDEILRGDRIVVRRCLVGGRRPGG